MKSKNGIHHAVINSAKLKQFIGWLLRAKTHVLDKQVHTYTHTNITYVILYLYRDFIADF